MNKIAVVYSSYYKDVVDGLLDGIKNTIHESFNLDYFKVPGSWDIVYKTNTLSKEYKIFIAVGIICKGDTDHYEYISLNVMSHQPKLVACVCHCSQNMALHFYLHILMILPTQSRICRI